MTCGLCGSGITADEKFKYQKNGNVLRYVYYKCARTKNPECANEYINENDLINQFIGLMDTIDLSEIGIKQKIKIEVEKIKKFQRVVLGSSEKIEIKDIDIRHYARYLLKEGSDIEKRELLGCFKSKMGLTNKVIAI